MIKRDSQIAVELVRSTIKFDKCPKEIFVYLLKITKSFLKIIILKLTQNFERY